jgi:hypothetical protein
MPSISLPHGLIVPLPTHHIAFPCPPSSRSCPSSSPCCSCSFRGRFSWSSNGLLSFPFCRVALFGSLPSFVLFSLFLAPSQVQTADCRGAERPPETRVPTKEREREREKPTEDRLDYSRCLTTEEESEPSRAEEEGTLLLPLPLLLQSQVALARAVVTRYMAKAKPTERGKSPGVARTDTDRTQTDRTVFGTARPNATCCK